MAGSNLISVLKRLAMVFQYLFFKLIGLSPWTIDITELLNNRRMSNYKSDLFKYSISGLVYNLLLIFLLSSLHIYGDYLDYFSIMQRMDSSYTVFLSEAIRNFGTISTLIIWINLTVRQRKIVDLVKRIVKLDKKLQSYDFISIKRKNNCSIYLVFIIKFVLFLFVCSSKFYLRKMEHWLLSLLTIIPIVVISWSVIQFTLMMVLIKRRFEILNKLLLSLGNLVDDEDQIVTADDFLTSKTIIVGSITQDIDDIIHMHRELCELWSEVLTCYGVPVLVAIFYFYGASTTTVYFIWVYSKMKSNWLARLTWSRRVSKFTYLIFYKYGSTLLGLVSMIFCFFVMTNTVTKTINESKKTARNIHTLQNKCLMNEKNYDKLSEFSLSLLHKDLEYSACDFMVIDITLLLSMLDTVVGYSIILIGFRQDPKFLK